MTHATPHFYTDTDGDRICDCLCPECYDTETLVLDDMCTCVDCECVNSDHPLEKKP